MKSFLVGCVVVAGVSAALGLVGAGCCDEASKPTASDDPEPKPKTKPNKKKRKTPGARVKDKARTKSNADDPKPPPKRKKPTKPVRRLSLVKIPISISMAQLGALVDKELPETLLEEDKQKLTDSLSANWKATRDGPAVIKTRKGRIEAEIPVQIKGSADWKPPRGRTRRFPFRGRLIVTVETRVSVNKKWTVRPTTTIDHRWTERISVNTGLLRLDIADLVDARIRTQTTTLARLVDRLISNQLNARDLAQEVWSRFRKPLRIEKDPPIWLQIEPVGASVDKLRSKGDDLIIPVGLRAHLEVVVGKRPKKMPRKKLPDLDTKPRGDKDKLSIYFPISLSYKDATRLAGEALVDKTFPVEGGVKIKIDALTIGGNGDQLVVEIGYTATLQDGVTTSGRAFMTGTPDWNTKSRTVRIKDFDYDLETRNALIKTRDWMLHDDFVKEVERKLVFPLGDQLDATRKLIEKAVRKQPLNDSLALRVRLSELEIDHFDLQEKAAIVVVRLKGRAKARVKPPAISE